MSFVRLTAIAGLLAAMATTGTAQTTLSIGSWTSSTDPFALAIEDYRARVAEASGGRITLDATYDGQIISLRTALSGVRDGLIDIGVVAGLVTPTETRMEAVIMDHATIISTPYAMSAAVMDFVEHDCEQCRDELAAQRIVPLAYMAYSPFYLMCRDPIEDISQLRGLQIRGVVAYSRFAEYLGATPVYTSPTELYEAISRGQVACAIGGASWLRAYGLADVVTFVADMSLGQAHNNIFGINADVWEGLSEEDRTILVENLPYLVRRAADHNMEQVAEIRAAHPEIWVEPSQALRDAFAAFQEQERTNVVTAAVANGVADAERLLRALETRAAEWNDLIEATGGDPAQIEALYRERLFQ